MILGECSRMCTVYHIKCMKYWCKILQIAPPPKENVMRCSNHWWTSVVAHDLVEPMLGHYYLNMALDVSMCQMM